MKDSYIILKFGNRRVVLRGTSGSGKDLTYTKYQEGHLMFDFHDCEFVGSVIVTAEDPEPTLASLMQIIDKRFLLNPPLEVSVELNNCPIHGAVDRTHRCPAFDGILRDAWTGEGILG